MTTTTDRKITETLLTAVRELAAQPWPLGPGAGSVHHDALTAYRRALAWTEDLPGGHDERVVELTVDHGLTIDQALTTLRAEDQA